MTISVVKSMDKTLWCSQHQEYLPIAAFSKNKAVQSGYNNWCKTCMSTIQKERYRAFGKPLPEAKAEDTFAPTKTCSTCKRAKTRDEFGKNRRRKDQLDSRCKMCLCDKDRHIRSFLKTDPNYRIRCAVSSGVVRALRGVSKKKNGQSCFDYLPFTREELILHLEAQFTDEINWDNYGSGWHVDHIIPQAFFAYDSMESQAFKECWALDNLRPLRADLNLNKSSIHKGRRYFYQGGA